MKKLAEAIVKLYYGKNPQKIASLGGGWFGRVFLAEITGEPKKVIIKIHLLPNLAEKEACQLEVLASHATVKMPVVFFVHKMTADIPKDAIIMEYIPGYNAGNHNILEIEEKNRIFIANQIVDNLISYHKVINPEGFGEIGSNAFKPDWKNWYKSKADEALSKGELLYSSQKIDDIIFRIIQRAHKHYDRIFYLPINEARLIHGDYNTWNILLDGTLTHVNGVIDPLNCCFADSEKDLYQLKHANGKEFKLLDIYGSKVTLSENFPLKMSFYEFFDHVAHYYDANVEIDYPFMTALAKELEQQMQKFGI